MIERAVGFLSATGEQLSGVLTFPADEPHRALVILMHGYGSNKNNRTNHVLVPRLSHSGVATLRFDFSGHGDSTGDIADLTLGRGVKDLAGALAYAKRVVPEDVPTGLLGGSFGGNIAVLHAANYPFKALALKSPISDYTAVRRRQLGENGIRRWREDGVVELSGGICSRYGFYEEALRTDTYSAAALVTAPTLIVQGDRDEDILLEETQRLAEAIPDARLTVIHGADHGYSDPQHFSRMIDAMGAFLVSYLISPQTS